MFEDSKASKFFAEFSDMLAGQKRESFSAKVRALFDKKITSDGEVYSEFKITVGDIKKIAAELR